MKFSKVAAFVVMAPVLTTSVSLAGPVEASVPSIALAGEQVFQTDPPTDATYGVHFDDAVGLAEVVSAADSSGVNLVQLSFAGPEAVGATQVPENSSPATLEALARDLFARVDRPVPAVNTAEVVVHGGDLAAVAKLRAHPRVSAVRRGGASGTKGKPPTGVQSSPADAGMTAAAENVFEQYFPKTWKGEANNAYRCTSYAYVGGPCHATTPLSEMQQLISNDNHRWPQSDWGLEVSLDVYNSAVCSGGTANDVYQPGWWAAPQTYQWVTNVPRYASSYLDDNRLFDDCTRLTQSFGIGWPWSLISGYKYSFFIATRNPNNVASSRFGAGFQAVSNDCDDIGRDPHTDCMGLNTSRVWRHGMQSQIVVNRNRSLTVPGCARMASGWSAPVYWRNGTRAYVPSGAGGAGSYYDTCMPNVY